MQKNLTDELRRRMARCDQTQEQIASAAGVTQPTISRILAGAEPKMRTYEALIIYLDTLEGVIGAGGGHE